MSVVAQPGFWRKFRKKLRTLTDTQISSSKIIVACKAEDALGLHGTCFVWVDASLPAPYARILSMGYNADLAPEHVGGGWNPAVDDLFVLSDFGSNGVTMGRMGPHEYPPTPITNGGATYFHDSRSVPTTHKSGAFRKSVPTRPTRRPILLAAADLNEPCNRLHAGTETMTAVAGNATIIQTNAFPHWEKDRTGNYNQFTALATNPKSNLCYRDKFFRFIKAERPRSPKMDDTPAITDYAVETGTYIGRVVNYITCIEPHTQTTGSGLNDLEVGGTYNGTVDATYEIEISVAAAPDSYRFRKDGGGWSGNIAIGAANSFQYLDGATHAGSDGIRIRFTASTGHTLNDVFTFEAHYVGESKPGDPSRPCRVGEGGSTLLESRIDWTRITRGKAGVGGRRIYRTACGPYWKASAGASAIENLCDGTDDPAGRVGKGVHKWRYSFYIPGLGESCLSPEMDSPERNDGEDGSLAKDATYLLKRIHRAPTFAKFDGVGLDNMLVGGRYTAGDPDDDYEIIVRIATTAASPDTYEWFLNGVSQGTANCTTGLVALGATGISVAFNAVDGHTVADEWVINRNMNLTTRFIYRSNGGGVYRRVGVIPHNRGTIFGDDNDNWFVDNVSDEEWEKGVLAPDPKDLPYFLVGTITDHTTTTYTDRVRTLNTGAKLDLIPDAVDHNRVVMPFRYVTADTRPGMTLEANTIAFVAATGPELTGDVKEVPIDRPMQAGDWELLDLYWPHGQFEARSYGFRLLKRDKSYTSVVNPQFSVGSIYINRAKYGSFTGKVGACLSFRNKETIVETNSSPPSPTINLGEDPSGVMALVHGYRGFWDTQTNGYANDPVGLNKPPDTFKNCGLYLAVHSWAKDADGNAPFRLVSEDMTYPGTSSDDPRHYLDRYLLVGNKFSPFLGSANSYAIGSSIAVETEDGMKEDIKVDLQELYLSAPLHNFKARKPACKYAVRGGRRIFMAGEEDFSVGQITATKYKDIANYKSQSFVRRTVGSGLTDLTITGNWNTGTVQDVYFKITGTGSPNNFQWKKGAAGVWSGNIAMTGAAQAITDGISVTWAATTGHTLNDEFRATTSKLQEWMQGRKMIIDSSDTDYNNPNGIYPTKQRKFQVLQILDDITMRIGSDFNRQTESWKENFYGTTGTYNFKIEGNKTSVFSTVETKELGANMDYWWELHDYPVPMTNDKVTGLGYAGNYLLAFGKNGAWRNLQNRDITDDTSGGPFALSEWDDIHGAPGCIAGRTITSLPRGRVAWLTPDYRIAIGSAEGFEFFEGKDRNRPISARIRSWLKANVDPELVEHAHASYDRQRDRYHIYFIANDGVSGTEPVGSTIDVTTPATDFYYRLTVDFRFGVVYPAKRIRMSATLVLGQDTVSDETSPGKTIGGDIFGYLSELDVEAAQSRGVPEGSAFEYTISGYSGGAFTVTPATLPTTGDGLKDVEFRIEDSSGNQEWLRVSSNTGNTITPAVAPVLTPASGDELLLGAIECDIRGMEIRNINESVIESIQVDTHDPAGGNAQQYRWTIYGAQDDGLYTEGNAQTLTTSDFTVEDLKIGEGRIWPEQVARRSLQGGISWTQRSSPTPTELLAVHMFVRTWEREHGRSFDYA